MTKKRDKPVNPGIQYIDASSLKAHPQNPRLIKDESFKRLCKSIEEDKRYFEARPIICSNRTGELVIIAGNMRWKAAKEIGMKQVPVDVIDEMTEEDERRILLKDNGSFGEWDLEVFQEFKFNELPYIDFGITLPGIELDPNQFGDSFTLKEGDKAPFQQMTFTLADEQAEQIKNAIEDIKHSEEYKYAETFGNENSNGNALYLIVMQWAEQKR